METIFRSQVMDIINSGKPFDLEIVTADRRRGTGGEYITLRKHCKLQEQKLPGQQASAAYTSARDRNNHLHKTFIVYNPANPAAHPITVHWRLMQVINGKLITNG